MAKVIHPPKPNRPPPDPPRINEGALEKARDGRIALAQEIVTRVAELEDRLKALINALQSKTQALESARDTITNVLNNHHARLGSLRDNVIALAGRVAALEAALPQQPEPDPPSGEL